MLPDRVDKEMATQASMAPEIQTGRFPNLNTIITFLV